MSPASAVARGSGTRSRRTPELVRSGVARLNVRIAAASVLMLAAVALTEPAASRADCGGVVTAYPSHHPRGQRPPLIITQDEGNQLRARHHLSLPCKDELLTQTTSPRTVSGSGHSHQMPTES